MFQIQEPILKQELLLIVYFVSVLLFFIIFAVVFVTVFQKRKNKLLIDRIKDSQKFEKELSKSQIEIQEQTLKNIAWELHDNVGQLLSVVNIQLNMLLHTAPENCHETITGTKDLVSQSVNEIRSLSKVLNNDVVLENGLLKSLDIELARFNRLNFLEASYEVIGEELPLNSAHEIIIFRILQEFLSNIIKHAKASKLTVRLTYTKDALEILAKDDGIGFDFETTVQNSGMQTMKSRADLLKAEFSINSKVGEGTSLFLLYPYQYGNQSN